jgi:hypothetical protein
MKSFIRVVELWVPDKSGTRLEFAGGLYDQATLEFRDISELALFARDEGLPGKAWAARHPIILPDFSDSYFKRADEAKMVGLACGVALPVFAGDSLAAVMVLFCGDDERQLGAAELWHNSAERSHEMKLVDGYYRSPGMFEFDSRHISFLRGYGLPGRAWKADAPVMLKNLGGTSEFLRAQAAAAAGFNVGLGIPYKTDPGETWVVSLLSAPSTPVARRFEIWAPDASGDAMVFQSGYCSLNTDLDAAFAGKSIGKGEGPLGRALAARTPVISDDLKHDASIAARSATAAGLHHIAVLPVLHQMQFRAAVAWYF